MTRPLSEVRRETSPVNFPYRDSAAADLEGLLNLFGFNLAGGCGESSWTGDRARKATVYKDRISTMYD